MSVILYTKSGCHLCEGLQEKLSQVTAFPFVLELRDIQDCADWWQRYQYEVPVLYLRKSQAAPEYPVPRPSPRMSVDQLTRHLQKVIDQLPHSGAGTP
ncbi:glutaredoxin family protein [Lyngbya confervoides BDU141951]|uniref:Glutaredoxin family protein n=1 Tax=Lyngbya confervoides BDU141951 TaxID=1574623 RepID=A0ABD4T1S2_9CYAN|nr:glutaredoxin family protein [Lyngbya confervoides]MCM1982474.1 glutaredoxin family protein [Lyngbya confervoides BDU141951]